MKSHKVAMPHIARLILSQFSSCWLVGSAAKYIATCGGNPVCTLGTTNPLVFNEVSPPRDWDIICTDLKQWAQIQAVIMAMPQDKVGLNSFGGYKIQTDLGEVDLWVGDLSEFILRAPVTTLYHFRTGRYWSSK